MLIVSVLISFQVQCQPAILYEKHTSERKKHNKNTAKKHNKHHHACSIVLLLVWFALKNFYDVRETKSISTFPPICPLAFHFLPHREFLFLLLVLMLVCFSILQQLILHCSILCFKNHPQCFYCAS